MSTNPVLVLLLVALCVAPPLRADCPPREYGREALVALKADGFRVADDRARQALAGELLDCLGHPDPLLRDGIAFEGLSTWMRAGALEAGTLRDIEPRLRGALRSRDPAGFRAPFAALVLSEVARVDRLSPFLTPGERLRLLDAGTAYLRSVRDYRGFINGEGWRHGVAHGSDLLLQLALNPALDVTAAAPILDALATQVAPVSTSYHFGEEGRLARVVVAVISRGWLDQAAWDDWFQRLSNPAPLSSWNEAFGREADLARLHNLRAFLLALHVRIADSEAPEVTAALPGLRAAIERIP